MSALVYPSTLPQPIQTQHKPNARTLKSDTAGAGLYVNQSQDYTGTVDVTFFFTRDQAEIFYAWWLDDLLEGGRWFSAAWPHVKPGDVIGQFISVPQFQHVYDGAHRVTARLQVRGASVVPQEPVDLPSDPLFQSVTLLLHGDGEPGGTVFKDSSKYNRSPAVAGSITTVVDNAAFDGSSIYFTAGTLASSVTFSGVPPIRPAGSIVTLEFFLTLTNRLGTDQEAPLMLFKNAADVVVGSLTAGYGNSLDSKFQGSNFSHLALVLNQRRHHVYQLSTAGTDYRTNGAVNAPSGGATATLPEWATVTVGNSGAYFGNSIGGRIEELRITINNHRYTEPGGNYTVPTEPFPNK